jgi:hypothetical protein
MRPSRPRTLGLVLGSLLLAGVLTTNPAAAATATTTPTTAAVAAPRALAHVPVCDPLAPAPTDSFPGQPVVADNFESGVLSGYLINTAGTGSITISDDQAHSAFCSVHLHATADDGSLADMSVQLPGPTVELYTDGWFDITTAGNLGSDVPYFRFFAGSTRAIDLYRYNDNGQLWLRTQTPGGAFGYTRLTWWSIPLSSWHHVQMHVITNGSNSTVEVWFDETEIFSSALVNTFATSVTSVLLGAEHFRQTEDNYADDLIVKDVR